MSPNDPASLSYVHIARSDSTIEGNVSSLGQALGTHMSSRQQQQYQDNDYRITSPASGAVQGSSSTHSPIFTAHSRMSSPGLKRKQPEPSVSSPKRRRPVDDSDLDPEGSAGSKHWSDDEKTKLFTWLMGRENDDNWNTLRATKNSCLRECASVVFEGKKSYQALKGCYERNFIIFRQIYNSETFSAHNGLASVQGLTEAERLHEQERRLQLARKAGIDVGNLNCRVVDHWHRLGWYELFFYRWQGDSVMTIRHDGTAQRPLTSCGVLPPSEVQVEEESNIDYPGSNPSVNATLDGIPQDLLHPYSSLSRDPPKDSLDRSVTASSHSSSTVFPHTPSSGTNPEPPVVTLNITNAMMQQYLDYLRAQTEYSRMKLDYLRRKEEREERDRLERRELERRRLDREASEFEYRKQVALNKEKADRAIQLLSSVVVDGSIKQYASDYLKKLLTTD